MFLRTTTPWAEPKVAFRLAAIEAVHLAELVTDGWRVQAPKYLRHEFVAVAVDPRATELGPAHDSFADGDESLEL